MPIVCVDALVVGDVDGEPSIGLIRRADGAGREGWALIGGRVRRYETLHDAVSRHVEETLEGEVAIGEFDVEAPQMVVQYFPDAFRGERVDPAKHSVSSSYVVPVTGILAELRPRRGSEALDFRWFALATRPATDQYAHGHGSVVERLLGSA